MAELPGELGYKKATGASIDISASGDNTLITCPAGSQIRIFQLWIWKIRVASFLPHRPNPDTI
jgi:DNA polymerase IIIc chi subunit|tara:strand:+ start:358 stop:546 length:189 start_codon:yes stop_codon:yes gene_type:complete